GCSSPEEFVQAKASELRIRTEPHLAMGRSAHAIEKRILVEARRNQSSRIRTDIVVVTFGATIA
ncbi:MAG TPA: hypothetical protein VFS96_02120, partial [Nitrolancea sp.]|nr:hypothetical protein [Nitrolancea sp.]